MRHVVACAGALACLNVCCVAASSPAASNSTKMTEAAVFAGAAAAAQVVESAMEARARNKAPVGSSGLTVTAQCDNEGQYGCVTVSGGIPAPPPPEPEMNDDQARGYVLDYVNGVRRLGAAGALVREPTEDAVAQAASERRSRDTRPGGAPVESDVTLEPGHAEVRAVTEATPTALLQERLGAVLLRWMDESPDGPHRRTVVRPEWRKMGVGIVTKDGRTFFTVDFST